MNWLERVIAKAFARTGNSVKVDRGWNWSCYCPVCCEIRAIVRQVPQ